MKKKKFKMYVTYYFVGFFWESAAMMWNLLVEDLLMRYLKSKNEIYEDYVNILWKYLSVRIGFGRVLELLC